MKNKTTYIIAITFIWIGFVGAISFMEAWLKFQAPSITIELGLEIGQLVFKALNRVEVVCTILILILSIADKVNRAQVITNLFYIPVIIIVIQTMWLLPQLDHRAALIISGIDVAESKLHFWYILLEVVKVCSLFIYGIKCLKNIRTPQAPQKMVVL